jgi:hypothetical protein
VGQTGMTNDSDVDQTGDLNGSTVMQTGYKLI